MNKSCSTCKYFSNSCGRYIMNPELLKNPKECGRWDNPETGFPHWEAKNVSETTISKLRNQLSPYYSLPDMILSLDAFPDMKPILLEQAAQAAKTRNVIKQLLTDIENERDDLKERIEKLELDLEDKIKSSKQWCDKAMEKANEVKNLRNESEQIWEKACQKTLDDISEIFSDEERIIKVEGEKFKQMFRTLGKSIKSFPIPKQQ